MPNYNKIYLNQYSATYGILIIFESGQALGAFPLAVTTLYTSDKPTLPPLSLRYNQGTALVPTGPTFELVGARTKVIFLQNKILFLANRSKIGVLLAEKKCFLITGNTL